jgi:hypothetical protein
MQMSIPGGVDFPYLWVDDDFEGLASQILRAGTLPKGYLIDRLHIRCRRHINVIG